MSTDRHTSWPQAQSTAWDIFRDAVRAGDDPDEAAVLAGLPVIPDGAE